MAKSNDKFTVPTHLREEYKRLTQLANRRVKSIYKQVEKTAPGSVVARAVLKGYASKHNWASEKMPFSRSIKGYYITDAETGRKDFIDFRGEKDFQRHLDRLYKFAYDTGDDKWSAERHIDVVLDDRANEERKKIIQGLNNLKDQYNYSLPGGQLPQEVIDELNSMDYNQLAHFWSGGVVDDIEVEQWDSDDFIQVASEKGFVDTVLSRIAESKKFA